MLRLHDDEDAAHEIGCRFQHKSGTRNEDIKKQNFDDRLA